MAPLVLLALVLVAECATFKAGVGKVNASLPLGVPLGGYNHGARRVATYPLPVFKNYSNLLVGNEGVLTTTWAKALILDDGEGDQVLLLTLDAMSVDGDLITLAHQLAWEQGLTIPYNNIIGSGSHSHSGPGAWTPYHAIQITPTLDLFVPYVQRMLAERLAEAMLQAQANLAPAAFAIGNGTLIGASRNRRAGRSPYVTAGTIDPHLGIIRVDDLQGKPVATLWNFAMHGVCFGPENLLLSADISGGVSEYVESTLGGVALYVNADAGDIDPTGEMCANKPNFNGSSYIGNAVITTRSKLSTVVAGVDIASVSQVINFGFTNLNMTLQRMENCTEGGPFDLCGICRVIHCDVNGHLGPAWVEQDPRFTAIRISVGGVHTAMVSIPGEALVELGWQIRNDTLALGYQQSFLFGYSNNYLMYFCTPNEYDVGGYESQMTLWGIQTSAMVRAGCKGVASLVAPSVY